MEIGVTVPVLFQERFTGVYSVFLVVPIVSYKAAQVALKVLVQSLVAHGWMINGQECSISSSEGGSPGHGLTQRGTIQLTEERFLKFRDLLQKFTPHAQVQVRVCLQLLGLMVAALDTVLWAKFHLRALQVDPIILVPGHGQYGESLDSRGSGMLSSMVVLEKAPVEGK
nr:PREDICTED: uncharacterized protein LOC106703530 [Latimeria chalumnae]|eukprot:XP_014344072.1 PREDICTED: uncharacterized protein LOC106703530 [Latimeria chalumnae]